MKNDANIFASAFELTKEMVEGALDDDLDNMYEPYSIAALDEEIPASLIIKTFAPSKYAKYIKEYCERNHILVMEENGEKRYFELERN